MNILVIGGGGREHAIISKLSNKIRKIICTPGNAGISQIAECINIQAINSIKALIKKSKIDFCVVTPDNPLVLGMVDALDIPCFGPTKSAAIIEGSKVFSKNLMKKYNIPTAQYETFNNINEAKSYTKTANYPLWIKTDGLALGKGAIMAESPTEANNILEDIMIKKIFNESGNSVVIEEHMTGQEATVLAFTDGKTIKPMISSMDYKRAFDKNMGPNTGGMGAIAPNPFYTKEIEAECLKNIFIPTIRAMENENRIFKGCLYFGLMLTKDGPKVVEYNCRFGDPETQTVLSLLDTDLFDIMLACNNGNLDKINIKWKEGTAACVVLASGGYPGKYEIGKRITGITETSTTKIYHAGTSWDNGYITSGGRVLNIVSTATDLSTAIKTTYEHIKNISFEGMFYRSDIGAFSIFLRKTETLPRQKHDNSILYNQVETL